ncbi:MAG: hypothetical protein R3284_09890 [Rubricoccaceae bacterium]|nr:hypothetical protein [Rubricoccaceae bacterium]
MTVEQRISKLERTNSRSTVAFLALLVTAVLGLSSSPRPPSDIVRAQGFQLVDSSGAVRAELRMGSQGPHLFLLDEQERKRIDLYHDDDASGLYIYDHGGDTRVGLAYFAHGGGGLAVHGPEGRGASVLYMQGTGPGRVSFYDSTGVELTRLSVAE